jgi:hypothetical protein
MIGSLGRDDMYDFVLRASIESLRLNNVSISLRLVNFRKVSRLLWWVGEVGIFGKVVRMESHHNTWAAVR